MVCMRLAWVWCLGLVLSGLALPALALEVTVSDAWVRQNLPGETATSAFVTLRVSDPASLVGAQCEAAGTTALAQVTRHASGFVSNRMVEGIALEPGKPNVLGKSGYHIMLMNLKPSRLLAGETIQIRLKIKTDGGEITVIPVDATVRGLVAR